MHVCIAVALAGAAMVVVAEPAMAGVGWSISSVDEPTDFNFADAQDEIVELTVTATEGTYELLPSNGNVTTAPIAWDASAEELQKALEVIPSVGTGNVSVTGGPGASKSYMITWIGALSASEPGSLLLRENKLKTATEEGTIIRRIVQANEARDRITVTVINIGNQASEGEIMITDGLPAGLLPVAIQVREPVSNISGECSLSELKCTYGEPIRPGREMVVDISVAIASPSLTGRLVNKATVEGGNGGEVSTNASNPVNVGSLPFGITGFAFEASGTEGTLDAQAGDHPYGVTTTVDLNTVLEGAETRVVQDPKDISVNLPVGFVGDPLATQRCPEIDLTDSEGDLDTPGYRTTCPPASQVGRISFVWGNGEHTVPFPIYNVVPERGYPAELGFNAGLGQPIFLYASVVPSASGYEVRVAAPGAIRVSGLKVESIRATIFGDPGAVNGTGDNAAFVTNPTGCPTAPLKTHVYVTSWEGGEASEEATAYPEVTGCDQLQGAAAFDPSFAVEPETTQADTPSGYTMDLKLPQAPSVFGALATPDLKNATITLPAGVSLSPSAASGPDALGGCQATGKEGINIGSSDMAPDGQDLGDPEATELGAGHPGGNGSPYDDGLYHTAPGHCPGNSRLGEVEARTPDLSEALHGHVYLMDPLCGRLAQPPCSEAEAEEGKVFRIGLELSGSGVIVKLEGRIEVGGQG